MSPQDTRAPPKPATVPKATTAIRRKPQRAPAEFPIVAIGALAGGLDALGQFLAQVPEVAAWPTMPELGLLAACQKKL